MTDDGFSLPDDVLVKILLLIPGILRHKFRHVCKGWRDLIDERTPKHEYCTQILVFMNKRGSSLARVFDGTDGLLKYEWTFSSCSEEGHVYMVGTCNGLLCLHDKRSFQGFSCSTITVTNPITGKRLELPPVPTPWTWDQLRSHGKYSFGYHPVTGKYKVVHIPCVRHQAVKAVQVFTIGKKMWREVQVLAPDASCNLSSEPLSVGGRTYWLTASSDRVMALDLKDEHVTSFAMPSVMQPDGRIGRGTRWRLTNVHGCLGVVIASSGSRIMAVVWDLWVMEGGGEQPQWTKRYNITDTMQRFWIMAPQLTYGDYMLSVLRSRVIDHYWYHSRVLVDLYRHKFCNLTHISEETKEHHPTEEPKLVMNVEEGSGEVTTYAYIENSRASTTNAA